MVSFPPALEQQRAVNESPTPNGGAGIAGGRKGVLPFQQDEIQNFQQLHPSMAPKFPNLWTKSSTGPTLMESMLKKPATNRGA